MYKKIAESSLVVMLFVLPLIALSRVFASIIRGFQKPVLAQMFELVVRPVLVITIVLVGFGLFFDLRTPEFAMFGQLTAGLVIAVSSLYVVHRICFANTDSERPEYQTRKWLKSALPFTLISGASVAGDQFLTILVGWLGSTADVGLYRVTIQGSAVVTFGYAAIVSVVSPHMTRLYVQKDSRKLEKLVKTSTRGIVLLAFPVVLLLVIAGGDLAAWVFGPDFRECGLALAVLSVFTLIGMSLGPKRTASPPACFWSPETMTARGTPQPAAPSPEPPGCCKQRIGLPGEPSPLIGRSCFQPDSTRSPA